MRTNITEEEALHRGYEAGNYASAYVSENYTVARQRRGNNEYLSAWRNAYDAAFLLDFFSTYETHEIPYAHRADVVSAEYRWGPKMRKAGIAVDERGMDE